MQQAGLVAGAVAAVAAAAAGAVAGALGRAARVEAIRALAGALGGAGAVQWLPGRCTLPKCSSLLKISAPDGTGCDAEPLRLAVSHLLAMQQVEGTAGTLYHSNYYPDHPTPSYYAVAFSQDCMLDKHVIAAAGHGKAWFRPYANMSGASRAD